MIALHVEADAPDDAVPLGAALVWLASGEGPVGAAWRIPGTADPALTDDEVGVYLGMVAGALRQLADELEERARG